MKNQAQTSYQITLEKSKLNVAKSLTFLLYTEDLDFAQSLSMLFRRDFHKVITVNDRENFLSIIKFIKPNFIIIDSLLNESLYNLLLQIKSHATNSKVYVFTSYRYEQTELEHKLKSLVDRTFFQPIDLSEFTQEILFQAGD